MRRKAFRFGRDFKIFILFLDIDGVLNSWASAVQGRRRERRLEAKLNRMPNKKRAIEDRDYALHHTGRREVSNLNHLLETMPDLFIVISSTWRKGRTVQELRDQMAFAGLKYPERIIDKTPVIYLASGELQKPYKKGDEPHQPTKQVRRGLEIAAWLDVAHTDKTHNVRDFLILDDDSDMVFLKHKLVQTGEHDGLTMLKVSEILTRFGVYDRTDHMEALDKRT